MRVGWQVRIAVGHGWGRRVGRANLPCKLGQASRRLLCSLGQLLCCTNEWEMMIWVGASGGAEETINEKYKKIKAHKLT